MGIFKRLKNKPEDKQDLYCAAVVPAAGSSLRMNGDNKLFMDLCGAPVIVHSISALENCPYINEIVIAAREEDIVAIGGLCRDYGFQKVTKVVCGGETRTASVLNGIMELSGKETLIAIHDAARPLATPELIARTVERAAEFGAAAPFVPVKDTIKVCRSGKVVSTPDRDELFAVQTPQVFDAFVIRAALSKALESHSAFSDDCAAVEAMGISVYTADGDYENIKITTAEDMMAAQAIYEGRQSL